jgi:hypothetical protein
MPLGSKRTSVLRSPSLTPELADRGELLVADVSPYHLKPLPPEAIFEETVMLA